MRRRRKLVPDDCLEVFEIRAVLYFTAEGEAYVSVDCPTDIPKHEAVGVLRMAEGIVLARE